MNHNQSILYAAHDFVDADPEAASDDLVESIVARVGDMEAAIKLSGELAELPVRELERVMVRLESLFGRAFKPQALRRAIRDSRPVIDIPQQRDGRPLILTNGRQLRDSANESLKALLAANSPAPKLFLRSGETVSVHRDDGGGSSIQALDVHLMRHHLTAVADFGEINRATGSIHGISPPMDIVADLLCRDLGFPALAGISESPILRPDGTIALTPGYDPATRMFYSPADDLAIPDIPDRPTADDLDAAVAVIDDIISDFPFVDQASRANAMAAAITPVVNSGCGALSPLFLGDGASAGIGKTYLMLLYGTIATGRVPTLATAPRDPEEWRKALLAILLRGSRIVVFDNVTGTLQADELAAVLTSPMYSARVLGGNDFATLPVRCTFFATGNNISLGGDMARRCVRIRLDAKTDRPFLRDNWRHRDLLAHVQRNRGQIIAAVLTLARAWFARGCPKPSSLVLGSFTDWSVMLGGILETAGVQGFLGNSDSIITEVDDGSASWVAFLEKLHGVFAGGFFTARDVWTAINDSYVTEIRPHETKLTEKAEAIREVIPEELLSDITNEGRFTRRLGIALRSRRDRRFGERQLRIQRDDDRSGVARWSIKEGA